MKKILIGCALLSLFCNVSAACKAPQFETFAQQQISADNNAHLTSIEVEMQPVATLRMPSGFTKLGSLPYGSVIFGGHPKGISAVLTYETEQTIAVHEKGVTPAFFMLSLFKGLNKTGCRYMEGQRLADEDYRLYAKFDKGAELFAYGKSSTHHFYLIHPNKPNLVLNGLFKNISRPEFEMILSTIVVK